jgi:general secretion pathway protein E
VDAGELEALGLSADTCQMEGVGCPRCRRTGYLGRTGLYEILRVTPEVAEAIYQTRPTRHLRSLARSQGMRTLREAGAATVRQGRTTAREVLAVTPPDEDASAITALAAHS